MDLMCLAERNNGLYIKATPRRAGEALEKTSTARWSRKRAPLRSPSEGHPCRYFPFIALPGQLSHAAENDACRSEPSKSTPIPIAILTRLAKERAAEPERSSPALVRLFDELYGQAVLEELDADGPSLSAPENRTARKEWKPGSRRGNARLPALSSSAVKVVWLPSAISDLSA